MISFCSPVLVFLGRALDSIEARVVAPLAACFYQLVPHCSGCGGPPPYDPLDCLGCMPAPNAVGVWEREGDRWVRRWTRREGYAVAVTRDFRTGFYTCDNIAFFADAGRARARADDQLRRWRLLA